MTQAVCILGVTGSIGKSTLKVLEQHPDDYTVFAVSAYSRLDELLEICKKYHPKIVVVPNEKAFELQQRLNQENLKHIEILTDEAGLITIAEHADVDIVMAAIVGAAGLLPTLAAVKAGKRVLLANKEALVMSGDIMMQAAREHNALLLPVDSEHNAIFQSLPHDYLNAERTGQPQLGVSRILLTASGGPFLNHSLEQLHDVTPQQACKHPNWSMGPKITIDSSTMVNKGLEVMEAKWLFGVDYSQIEVVIQPQSIIHSMVQYVDGAIIAQLGTPDMRVPIEYALFYPERRSLSGDRLDFSKLSQITFEKPDMETFKGLKFAYNAAERGGNIPTAMNAANELAVSRFLDEKIKYLDILNTDSVFGIHQSFQTKKKFNINDNINTLNYFLNK